MSFSQLNVSDQRGVLRKLAELTARSIEHPLTGKIAARITSDCIARDDECELQAIYDAVKTGHPGVRGLEQGLRYVSDPRSTDYFISAPKMLEACAEGACAGDCDNHAVLNASLAGAIGFKVGLRAWGPLGQDFVHVYAVVQLPKLHPSIKMVVAMDTTVPEGDLGWEPPKGRVLTAWLD